MRGLKGDPELLGERHLAGGGGGLGTSDPSSYHDTTRHLAGLSDPTTL